jgi:hypothetical protein
VHRYGPIRVIGDNAGLHGLANACQQFGVFGAHGFHIVIELAGDTAEFFFGDPIVKGLHTVGLSHFHRFGYIGCTNAKERLEEQELR